MGDEEHHLNIFISHAKLDGLPLAQSLKDQLNRFGGTSHFYDADCIPPGSDWKRVLRKGVEPAILNMEDRDGRGGVEGRLGHGLAAQRGRCHTIVTIF